MKDQDRKCTVSSFSSFPPPHPSCVYVCHFLSACMDAWIKHHGSVTSIFWLGNWRNKKRNIRLGYCEQPWRTGRRHFLCIFKYLSIFILAFGCVRVCVRMSVFECACAQAYAYNWFFVDMQFCHFCGRFVGLLPSQLPIRRWGYHHWGPAFMSGMLQTLSNNPSSVPYSLLRCISRLHCFSMSGGSGLSRTGGIRESDKAAFFSYPARISTSQPVWVFAVTSHCHFRIMFSGGSRTKSVFQKADTSIFSLWYVNFLW